MSAPVENLVQRLNAKRSGTGWMAKCPAHEDKTPSLSIGEGSDGRALLKCFAGCETSSVLAALNMKPQDLFPAKVSVPTATAPVKNAAAKTPNVPVQPRPLGVILDDLAQRLPSYVSFQCPEYPTA